jgi:predicted Fe-S protein YdhL (DUF1289 family)
MAILNETTGQTVACDGCGRTDAGPSQTLHIGSYAVHDPNVGSPVQHHYCAGCAANRGLAERAATIAGWERAASSALDEPSVAEEPA